MKTSRSISLGLIGLIGACQESEVEKKLPEQKTLSIATLPEPYSNSAVSVSTNDMNGDSRPDIIVGMNRGYRAEIFILYNLGNGQYSLELPTNK